MSWYGDAWGLLSSPTVDPETGLLNQKAMAAQGGLAGLTNAFGALSAAFAPSLQPGGVGRGLAMVGPAVQAGMQGVQRNGLLAQQAGMDNQWQKALADLPAEQRGLYGALGRQEGAKALLEERRNAATMQQLAPIFQRMGGGTPQTGFPTEAVPGPQTSAQPAPDIVARVIAAEAGNDPVQQAGVAAVIANRARLTGMTPEQVVQQPNQFEVVANGAAGRVSPDAVAKAAQAWQGVTSGQTPDPTNGATHFLNPQLQTQMGRQMPAWATGQATQIGPHAYYSRPGDFARRTNGEQSAQETPAAISAGAVRPQSGLDAQSMTQLMSIAATRPQLAPMVGAMMQMFRQENPNWKETRIGDGVFLYDPQNPMRRIRLGDAPEAAPRSAARFDQDRQIAEAGGARISQNTDMRAETAEAAGAGTALAKEGQSVRDQATAAAGLIDNIRTLRSLDANTGRLAPAKEVIGGWMEAVGLNSPLVRQAQNLQQFNGALSNLVLGKQLEQNGVQTEGDAQRMRAIYGSITNQAQANDFLLRAQEAQALRMMEKADFYQRWRSEAGENGRARNTNAGAAEAWNRTIRETPLVLRDSAGNLKFINEYLAEADAQNVPRADALTAWQAMGRRR